MNTTDLKTVKLAINSGDAANELAKVTAKVDTLKARLAQVTADTPAKSTAKLRQELARAEKEMNKLTSRSQRVNQVLESMDTATPKQLRETLKALNKELNSGSVQRGSKEWNALTAALRECKGELKKISTETKAATEMKEEVKSFGSSWMGITAAVAAAGYAIGQVKDAAMSYVSAYADMAEHEANVIKYTGLTRQEVSELNDEFKKMDTRTPREKLNDLAADAGRLGITSKEAVLDFVQAADQLNLALGEDLGEDAVKNIGKLAQLFGDADQLGLKQAMLSTGSVINELAQSSSAAESYLMEFTSRLAGVGHQAGMSQAQVMAFGSILDQGMVNVERSATALQNVITALYRDPAKLAKLAGLDVKEFSELLKKDGNAAVLQFIEALNKAGNMDALAPMLKDMKLSGSGVTQTLTTLAGNIDNLRATQEQATEAFNEGTSATNEAAAANNTVQAALEKADKQWKDLRVELGEQLYPVVNSVIQILMEVARFLVEHSTILVGLAATTAVLTSATLLHTLATKAQAAAVIVWNGVAKIATALQAGWTVALNLGKIALAAYTGNTAAATAAQIALNTAMKANPIGAVVSLVVLLVTALLSAVGAYKALESVISANDEAQQQLNKSQKESTALQSEAASSAARQVAQVRLLTSIIHDNNRSLADRKAAITALQKIIPNYTATISNEGKVTRENTKAVNDYVEALKKQALTQAVLSQTQDIYTGILTWEQNKKDRENELNVRRRRVESYERGLLPSEVDLFKTYRAADPNKRASMMAGGSISGETLSRYMHWNGLMNSLDSSKLRVKEANDIINENQEKIDKALSAAEALGIELDAALGGVTDGIVGDTSGNKKKGSKDEARKTKEERAIDEAAKAATTQNEINLAAGVVTYRKFEEEKQRIAEDALAKKRDLYKEESDDWQRHDDALANLQEKHATERQNWDINALKASYEEEERLLNEKLLKGEITEDTYDELRLQKLLAYYNDRIKILKEAGRAEEAEKLTQERDAKDEDARIEREKKFQERLKTLREQYASKSAAERMQDEIDMLDGIHAHGLLSEEEYQKMLAQIRSRYQGYDGKGGEISSEASKGGSDVLERIGYKSGGTKGSDSSADFGFSNLASAAVNLNAMMEAYDTLEELRSKDLISQQDYTAAVSQLDKERWENFTAVATAALSSVQAIMSSVSAFYQASQDEEEAKVTAKYDAEIEKVGESTAAGKKLEEKKQAELAKIKTKYNKKQMAIEIAQAIAQTAMNALMAYGAMAKIPIVGPALGIAAAAAATAAGMIQIATIKKQHAAEEAGYYEGGYTGGGTFRRVAGVVHEGEFVANHRALANPELTPLFSLLDYAQRHNTVSSLTSEDVAQAVAAPQRTASALSSTTRASEASTDTPAAQAAAVAAAAATMANEQNARTEQTLTRLADRLDEPITAVVTIDGSDGIAVQWKKYQRLSKK